MDIPLALLEKLDLTNLLATAGIVWFFYTRIEKKFAKVDEKFAKVDERFVQFEAKVDERFTQFEAKVDEKFNKLEEKIDKVSYDIHKVDTRVSILENKLSDLNVSALYLLFNRSSSHEKEVAG